MAQAHSCCWAWDTTAKHRALFAPRNSCKWTFHPLGNPDSLEFAFTRISLEMLKCLFLRMSYWCAVTECTEQGTGCSAEFLSIFICTHVLHPQVQVSGLERDPCSSGALRTKLCK